MQMTSGWVKLYRSISDNPTVTQSSDHLAVWIYLLTHATPYPYKTIFAGKEIELQVGQLITSRKTIANWVNSKISDAKIQRVLKAFENAHQIEQQTCNKNRLITLTNWGLYQSNEQQNEPQMNGKRTANEQQVNNQRTLIENKEYKNDVISRETSTKYASEIKEIVDYFNQKAGTTYRATTKNTIKHITARLKEGYTVADFMTVIDSKVAEWGSTEMSKYLRPDTLFGSKFESYLNVATAQHTHSGIDSMYADYAPAYQGGDVG